MGAPSQNRHVRTSFEPGRFLKRKKLAQFMKESIHKGPGTAMKERGRDYRFFSRLFWMASWTLLWNSRLRMYPLSMSAMREISAVIVTFS